MRRLARETWAQYLRWMTHLKREPFHITFTLIQPVIWLALFGKMMARVSLPGLPVLDGDQEASYLTFMLPGVVAFTVFGNGMSAGIPILFDREGGFLSKLLTTPATRSSIILGRFFYVATLAGAQTLVIVGLGLLLGARLETGLAGLTGLLVVGALLGLGLTVLSLGLAFLLHNHGEFFAILGVLTLPLMFTSSALVPPEAMPPWMRLVTQFNPMTHAVDAMRLLVHPGWDVAALARSTAFLILADALLVWLGLRIIRRKIS